MYSVPRTRQAAAGRALEAEKLSFQRISGSLFRLFISTEWQASIYILDIDVKINMQWLFTQWKSGCMSSLDKKGFMFCDDCHIVICNECCLACSRCEEILRFFGNVFFTHSYSRESSIERGSYSMAYYIAGHESERHHLMENTSALRMS